MHEAPQLGDWYEDDGCGEYMVYTIRDEQVADDLDNVHTETVATWVRVDTRDEVDDELTMMRDRGYIQ
jgi:hypothetical protein